MYILGWRKHDTKGRSYKGRLTDLTGNFKTSTPKQTKTKWQI